jgi:16S rRNA processing protein RimM
VAEPTGLTEVVVGRVGRAHGIRGEVSIELRTDEPERRFAVGTVLRATPSSHGSLTVKAMRPHGDRLLVAFEEARDRTSAEALRGANLVVDVEVTERPNDPEEFYDHQLVGLRVRTGSGSGADPGHGPEIGTVVDVRHLRAQDLLEVRLDAPSDGETGGGQVPDAEPVLVPFVRELVPEVDIDAGWLLVAPVPGLLADADAGGAGTDDED